MTGYRLCALANRHVAKLIAALIAASILLLVAVAPRAEAETRTTSFRPVDRTGVALTYNVSRVSGRKIRNAWLRVRPRRGRAVRRSVRVPRVRAAAREGTDLRVRRAGRVRNGKLEVAIEPKPEVAPAPAPDPEAPAPDPDPDPVPPSAGCSPDAATFTAAGCNVVFEDPGTDPDAESLWREVGCGFVDAPILSRHKQFATGGAPTEAGETGFRRTTAFDGDDFYGERCELGVNEHRVDHDPNPVVYREGQRWITEISLRLPDNYPLASTKWQTVAQMKQANPSAGGGGAPAMELQAKGGRWYVIAAWNDLWSAPAVKNEWTKFAFDVRYSQDPSKGTVDVYVDLNGDGDTADSGERSPTLHTATLKTEPTGGWAGDGIAPGDPIPSHLRTGVYHDPTLPCGTGCSLDIDNVEAIRVE